MALGTVLARVRPSSTQAFSSKSEESGGGGCWVFGKDVLRKPVHKKIWEICPWPSNLSLASAAYVPFMVIICFPVL